MQTSSKSSKDEIERDKKIILLMLKRGIARNIIAQELDTSLAYITQITKILVDEGKITHDEIRTLRRNNMKASFSEKWQQPLEEKEIQDMIQYRQQKKQAFLEGIRSGKTPRELAIELNLSRRTVEQYIKELAKEEREKQQTPEEIREIVLKNIKLLDETILSELSMPEADIQKISATYNIPQSILEHMAKKVAEEKTELNDSAGEITVEHHTIKADEQKILCLLRKGYENSYIAKKLNISEFEIATTIDIFIAKGIITMDEINNAMIQKGFNDQKEIVYYLKVGYRLVDIMEKMEFNYQTLKRIVDSLKQKGMITEQEINEARNYAVDQVSLETLILEGIHKDNQRKRANNKNNSKISHDSGIETEKFGMDVPYSQQVENQNLQDEINNPQNQKNQTESSKAESGKLKIERTLGRDSKMILGLIKKGITPKEMSIRFKMDFSDVSDEYNKLVRTFGLSTEQINEYRKERESTWNSTREKAKKEMEDDRKSITYRKKFMELAGLEVLYGNDLSLDDITMIGKFMVYNDNLLNKLNLKLVIMQYIKHGNKRTSY